MPGVHLSTARIPDGYSNSTSLISHKSHIIGSSGSYETPLAPNHTGLPEAMREAPCCGESFAHLPVQRAHATWATRCVTEAMNRSCSVALSPRPHSLPSRRIGNKRVPVELSSKGFDGEHGGSHPNTNATVSGSLMPFSINNLVKQRTLVSQEIFPFKTIN